MYTCNLFLTAIQNTSPADLQKEIDFKFIPRDTPTFEDVMAKDKIRLEDYNKKYPVKYTVSKFSNFKKCLNKYDRDKKQRR